MRYGPKTFRRVSGSVPTARFTRLWPLIRADRPIEVPGVIAETDEEKDRYASALRRRQLRLVLAGRMNAQDATELRAFLNGE